MYIYIYIYIHIHMLTLRRTQTDIDNNTDSLANKHISFTKFLVLATTRTNYQTPTINDGVSVCLARTPASGRTSLAWKARGPGKKVRPSEHAGVQGGPAGLGRLKRELEPKWLRREREIESTTDLGEPERPVDQGRVLVS